MKVVKYARSGWEGGTLSIERQRASLDTLAEHNGWEVVADESDMGSTSRTVRPGLEKAVELVKSGKAEAIIATGFDRVARAPFLVHHLMDQGVRVITPDLDTGTSTGRMVVRVIESVVEAERHNVSERIKNGMAAAKARREAGS